MESVKKIYLMGIETFVFFLLLTSILTVKYKADNNNVLIQKEVNTKTDIHTTCKDIEGTGNEYIAGGVVIAEIEACNGNYAVYVNSVLVNNLPTRTNQPYFKYAKDHGFGNLPGIVAVSGTYRKDCQLDDNGRLRSVHYTLQ